MTDPVEHVEHFSERDYFVSTKGNDRWSGKLAEPNADATDGPLATIRKAKDTIRRLKLEAAWSGPVTVWIRGGYYTISEAIEFTPEDSGPVTYAAYPGETPVFSGGRRITNWREEHIGGIAMFVADVPEAAAGQWYSRQLFVNGGRRPRPRLPKNGFYWMKDVPGSEFHKKGLLHDLLNGSDTFVCEHGDIQNWKNINDVDVVAFHYWTEERMPIQSFDERTGTVKSSRKSMFVLKDDVARRFAKYVVENVFEALSEPGEWYLDRQSGKIYYIPMPGESIDGIEAFAGSASQLLKLQGSARENSYVEYLRFRGLSFQHNDWRQPGAAGGMLYDNAEIPYRPGTYYAADPQAACSIPGAIHMEGARYCSIEDCRIEHVGTYGIEISSGCTGIRVVGNEVSDLGAGGIKIGGSDAKGLPADRTGHNRITDNHIHDGGHVFHSGVGILSLHSFGNVISHNHIHDLYYSGISCGWIWGYAENVSKNNVIEKNHIHDLGHGLLSDMGGIYTLGVQPGTVIRGNRIHHIEKCNYGGWAIYSDEGSSHLLIENNVCYCTSSTVFNQHYGRENMVRNNIFAFGREGQASLGKNEQHRSFTFERNIVISNGKPFYVGGYAAHLEQRGFSSDLNLLWDITGEQPVSGIGAFDEAGQHFLSRTFTWEEMRGSGHDLHSIVADPRFTNLEDGQFELLSDSPVFSLGFQPIHLSDAGPRPVGKRG